MLGEADRSQRRPRRRRSAGRAAPAPARRSRGRRGRARGRSVWPTNARLVRRSSARPARSRPASETPSSSTSPSSASSSPASRRSSVVFPEPDGPVTTVSLPVAKSASSRSIGAVLPNRFVRPRAATIDSLCFRNTCAARRLGNGLLERDRRGLCFRNTSSRRAQDDLAAAELGRRVAVDSGCAEHVFGEPEPAAASDDDRAVCGGSCDPLVRDAPVADVDDAVGALGGSRVVADDERGAVRLAHELGDQREHLARRRGVELARRLVGDQERRPARERRAERDPLLLAAGELARMSAAAVAEADALQQLVGPRVASRPGLARQPELDPDELARGQLARERAPVVLVGVADRARAEAGGGPAPEGSDVDAGDADRARRCAVETGDDPQQRRLAGAARPEDDAELALLDGQGQPLQGGDAAVRGGIDPEDILDLDEGGHSTLLIREPRRERAPARRTPAASRAGSVRRQRARRGRPPRRRRRRRRRARAAARARSRARSSRRGR